MPGSQKFPQHFNWKAISNFLRISDVCLQMSCQAIPKINFLFKWTLIIWARPSRCRAFSPSVYVMDKHPWNCFQLYNIFFSYECSINHFWKLGTTPLWQLLEAYYFWKPMYCEFLNKHGQRKKTNFIFVVWSIELD